MAKGEGKFDKARELYEEMRRIASEAGVILSEIKAILGIADTRRREVRGDEPLLSYGELEDFDELTPKVQGRLWQEHFARVRRSLSVNGNLGNRSALQNESWR